MAAALDQAGAKLALADLNLEMAEATAAEMRAGIKTIAIRADVAGQDSVKAMIATVVDYCGSLDIAFNNAGVNCNSAAEDTSMEEWDKTFDTNIKAKYMVSRFVVPVMRRGGSGVHHSSVV